MKRRQRLSDAGDAISSFRPLGRLCDLNSTPVRALGPCDGLAATTTSTSTANIILVPFQTKRHRYSAAPADLADPFLSVRGNTKEQL